MLSDGKLEICGRCDSMVKIRGYSVEVQVHSKNMYVRFTDEYERTFYG